MSGYQVVVSHDGRVWDSIRDTEREALYKVSEYMKRDLNCFVAGAGSRVQSALIFGFGVPEVSSRLEQNGFKLVIKYIP